jgi:hypothetical protein
MTFLCFYMIYNVNNNEMFISKQPFADLLARGVSPLFIKLILVTKQEVH